MCVIDCMFWNWTVVVILPQNSYTYQWDGVAVPYHELGKTALGVHLSLPSTVYPMVGLWLQITTFSLFLGVCHAVVHPDAQEGRSQRACLMISITC